MRRQIAGSTAELASEEAVTSYFVNSRADTDRLKSEGFLVGGRHEKILHVARIHPEFLLYGYIAKFFYVLFFPITYFHIRYRRSKNPCAHFFPLDYHRAGRIVLTDKRLVTYSDLDMHYFRHCSLPYDVIREVRQHRSSLRIQLRKRESRNEYGFWTEPETRTLTIRVGPDLGELLRAIHSIAKLQVRDPGRHW